LVLLDFLCREALRWLALPVFGSADVMFCSTVGMLFWEEDEGVPSSFSPLAGILGVAHGPSLASPLPLFTLPRNYVLTFFSVSITPEKRCLLISPPSKTHCASRLLLLVDGVKDYSGTAPYSFPFR